MKTNWIAGLVLLALVVLPQPDRPLPAAEPLQPGDPIAAVDGQAIYLGELNLVLTERIAAADLDRVGDPVKQATALLLVRRRLAMNALREQGGEALQASVQRHLENFASEARRRGTSLDELAQARRATEQAMRTDLAWKSAWSQYLKSRMTEANLRRFFDSHPDRYAGGRYEVSQIFVKVDADDAASVTATAERMAELVQQIRAAGSPADAFAQAAAQYSEAGSAEAGGRVGWVEKEGDLPGSVMTVVRRTMPGSVSDPVPSPLGMHIVFVHQSEPGTQRFEDLTDQSQIRRDAANAMFDALVQSQRESKVVWFLDSLRHPDLDPFAREP